MSEMYLVRHGQASFGSSNYDQLSELGYQQALWLGQHLKDQEVKFDRVLMGSMLRHKQTAQNICEGLQLNLPLEIHEGLNEYDFQTLIKVFLTQHPEQMPTGKKSRGDFYNLLKKALLLWSQGELNGPMPESWEAFKQRVTHALSDVQNQQGSQRTLVVSSAGPIAMSLLHVLKLDSATMIELNLQVQNTSYSQLYYRESDLMLSSFNNVAHMETPERKENITFG